MGLAMAAVLAPVAGVALASAIDDVRECQDDLTLTVDAAPEIAPVLDEYAQEWSPSPVEGSCVTVEVAAVDSASTAAAYAKAHDIDFDVGDAETASVELPDVWVAESPVWIARLGGDVEGMFSERIDSVAESAVGLAVPADSESGEEDPGDVLNLADTDIAPVDPHADAAILTLMMGPEADPEAVFTPTFDDDGAVPMSAAAVAAHNMQNPEEPLRFLGPQPPPEPFTYPYLMTDGIDSDTAAAANEFRSSLLSSEFTGGLGEYDLSPAGPYPDIPDVETVDAALAAWKP
ncbi:MAG: substrate-binding domain-containing protein [Stackebrandtia sp.]